uniref:Uncharacterized protein n=1 Tax=Lepeophtheirus salmonis TaxID=72036 RepID=A0A0K2V6G2_LEPSM
MIRYQRHTFLRIS